MHNRFSTAPTSSPGPHRALRRTIVALLGASALLWGRPAVGQVNVTTYHYDTSGTGQNLNEVTLNPANVNTTQFGKLFSYPVDGFVYTQPLYLSAVNVPGRGMHNVVYVATEHDSVYAFDADNPDPSSGGGQLWKRVFSHPIDPNDGITTIPSAEVLSTDIVPEIGITSTPVIDYDATTGAGTLFVLVKTREVRGSDIHYVQKLYALDVGNGADKIVIGGQLIGDTIFNGSGPYTHDPRNPCVPGNGDGSSGGQVCFNALRQMNRPGLALVNGTIYIAFASHGDNGPYHGWVLGYSETNLSLVLKFNSTPNGGLGGIWEGGDAPVFDADGSLYVSTGNGTFHQELDPTKTMYGDSSIRLAPDGSVLDFFTPFNQQALSNADADFGSGGTMLLPDQAGPNAHLLVTAGKSGKIFLVNRDNMGRYRTGPGCVDEPILETCDNVVQFTPGGTIGGSFGTPAYFNNGANQFIYYGGVGDAVKAFMIDPDTGLIDLPPAMRTGETFGFTGVTPTISANGTDGGILWALNVNLYGIPARPTAGPMILFAYNASDLSTPLYASNGPGLRDVMGNAVKFNTPTVANGHVYVGTQTTLEVLGLFDVATAVPPGPTSLTAMSGPPAPTPPSIILNWMNTASNATGVRIERSLDGTTNFTEVSTVGRNVTTFTDTTVAASTTYFYRVVAVNQVGDSMPSNVASAKTHIGAPVLQVDDIFDTAVRLTWTPTADDHYVVARATSGIPFADIGTVPAGTTTFTDGTLSAFGTYFYRVTAFNADGDNAASNTISATVGPAGVSHGGGFAGQTDLIGNANTNRPIFQGNLIRLTDGMNGEAGSVFTSTQVGIRKFTTSFTFQATPGTVPMADGLTFIIQGNSAMALGNGGGGMGYQTVARSVAIKFDLFNHGHGGYSTGQYVDGHNPDVPSSGEADVSLVGTGIDLTSGHVFKVDLSYDGTKLIETITDQSTSASFTIDDYPPVDIPGHVGGDTAFVGFGAGTGGLNAFQDILTWTFTANEAGLPPRKPSNLHVTTIHPVDATHFDISLAWKGNNAYTATRFKLERSTDGTTFSEIANVPVTQTTFTDPNLVAPGSYFYRVRSFDGTLNSAYTPVVCAPLGVGGEINHSTGFACNGDLNTNGTGQFAGSNARLTDGGGGEAGSVFTLAKVDVTHFTTSFKLQIHQPGSNPMADGMTFVIQGNSPTALGFSGGGLGYGLDTPGGQRGIRNSIAIKFDIFDNAGEGNNSTGLFSDGRSPTVPDGSSGDVLVDLRGSVIDLNSQHVFQVDLTYDGTTLTEKITDTNTSGTITTMYTVNIPAKVGGNTAFVGFTGGTGGLTATQDVQTWTFRNP